MFATIRWYAKAGLLALIAYASILRTYEP